MVSKKTVEGVSRALVVVVAVAVIIIAGVGVYYVTRPSAAAEQVLLVGTIMDVSGLDPSLDYGYPTILTHNLVFDSLLEWTLPDCREVESQLATDWTVSSDIKTYDFTLRQGVKFHDGTELTSADVKYSIERTIELGGPMSLFFANIDQVEVLDTYKVRVHLKSPSALIPKIFAMGLMCSVMPKNVVEDAGEDWGKTVLIGSGPFKFVEWVDEERIVLERNDDYWGKKPKLEKIILLLNMDPTVGKMALETGEIDMFYHRPLSQDIQSLKDNPDIEGHEQPTDRVRYLTFNNNMSIFQDKRVKQAICYGINVTRVLELGFMGDGQVTYSLTNPIIEPYYKPVFEKYSYDPDKAMALLTEAGYPDGFETDLLFTDALYDPLDPAVAVVIKDDLAKIGIDATLHFEETATFLQNRPTMPLVLSGWATSMLDPDWCMMYTIHGEYGFIRSWVFFNNARYEELGYLGQAETDPVKREAIYDEAQDILADECPIYPLTASNRWIFHREWVEDFTFYPSHWTDEPSFTDVYISPRD